MDTSEIDKKIIIAVWEWFKGCSRLDPENDPRGCKECTQGLLKYLISLRPVTPTAVQYPVSRISIAAVKDFINMHREVNKCFEIRATPPTLEALLEGRDLSLFNPNEFPEDKYDIERQSNSNGELVGILIRPRVSAFFPDCTTDHLVGHLNSETGYPCGQPD